jgi:hypothetical protein
LLYACDVIADLLKGKGHILRGDIYRNVTNYCFDMAIRVKVASEIVEVVLREVG